MANRYFFDKRDMKRGFAKYGIIFLISFVPILLFNIFVGRYLKADWLIVLLDCVFLLVFVVIGNHIANKIFEKKDKKLEARRKAREEMNARKKQILEDSYKRIREEKRANKIKNDEIVVEVVEKDNLQARKKSTKATEKKQKKHSSVEAQEIAKDGGVELGEDENSLEEDFSKKEEKSEERKRESKSKKVKKEDKNEKE